MNLTCFQTGSKAGWELDSLTFPTQMPLQFTGAMVVTKGGETQWRAWRMCWRHWSPFVLCRWKAGTLPCLSQDPLMHSHFSWITECLHNFHATCPKKVKFHFQLNQEDFAAFRHDVKLKIMPPTCFYSVRENTFHKKVTKTEKNPMRYLANIVSVDHIPGPAAP